MSQSTEMPFQAGEKIRADSGQEVPFQPGKKKNLLSYNSGQEEDGPEYRNVLSSGREDKDRLFPGSPFYNQEIRISSSIKQFGTKCSFSDARNIMKMPLSGVREEDGP
ncbi:hypothetical protein CHS0354_026676 [Potamilus streckersoni]|uniref:Uncharacterized protein n=1 Tax=Potamilus streckersoni TaxID=2493646 RepID=A0AAE0S856_9BIVA|nr:hypothetical protein CHS0354_026676 [Potamilus streckersoni]